MKKNLITRLMDLIIVHRLIDLVILHERFIDVWVSKFFFSVDILNSYYTQIADILKVLPFFLSATRYHHTLPNLSYKK